MNVQKFSAQNEKRILAAMVTDPIVLGRIATRWNGELFRSKWGNILGGWCVRYYHEYETAPHATIENLYEEWESKRNGEDADTSRLMDSFLTGISDQYEAEAEQPASEYIVDLADGYFNRVALERHSEQIQNQLESGNTKEAKETAAQWGEVRLAADKGIDPFNDEEAVEQAFIQKSDPLIVYPGALGDFFGDTLERDGFIAFMGPEKRGKSWWLMDIVYEAVKQRRRVAYFEVGDMSQNQIMRRLMTRNAGVPLYPRRVRKPKALEVINRKADLQYSFKTFKHGLSPAKAWAACEKRTRGRKGSLIRLSCHPNSSINVMGIREQVRSWDREGWVPDVIVIDYADILAPPAGVQDYREQINTTWKQLRGLSQTLHCLVVTATQADAASYNSTIIRMGNFSEDKRKLSHVTGMIGINQTPEEKDLGVQRLNWVARREGEYSQNRCVYVAECLPLGMPAAISSWDEGRQSDDDRDGDSNGD